MNKQMAQGNLVAAASVMTGTNGRDMLSFTVSCNEGKTKEGVDIVEFIPVVAYGKKGSFDKLKEFLGRGVNVLAVGKLVNRKNEKDNVVYMNSRIEIQGTRDIRLLNSASTTVQGAAEGGKTPEAGHQAQIDESLTQASQESLPPLADDQFDDDIPF